MSSDANSVPSCTSDKELQPVLHRVLCPVGCLLARKQVKGCKGGRSCLVRGKMALPVYERTDGGARGVRERVAFRVQASCPVAFLLGYGISLELPSKTLRVLIVCGLK